MAASSKQWKQALAEGHLDAALAGLYGNRALGQRARYIETLERFERAFGAQSGLLCVTAPGRTEIGGNHTDHNHGKVLTGSVNLDILAFVAPASEPVVRIQSKGHPENRVLLSELRPAAKEEGHSNALIRGILARLSELNYKIGGLMAVTTSDVVSGSGLSSSAAFEVLVGSLVSALYNGGAIDGQTLAKAGQYAENVYFKKPCWLMDQMGSACGGLIAIDFADPNNPSVEKLDYDFDRSGHALCIAMAGGSHADLTDCYAAIPAEMKSVAAALGVSVLRQADCAALMSALPSLRGATGDRALLRALHFYNENKRVDGQVAALKQNDFGRFLELINASGRSSFMYNQNITTFANPKQQEMALALAVSEQLLGGRGATRIHGGGFAGTVQAFVPFDLLNGYRAGMEALLGEGNCLHLSIRKQGATVWDLPRLR